MMKMDEGEIIRDYNAASNKKRQVEILADLNLVTKKEMANWLYDHGCSVDKRLIPERFPKQAKPDPVQEPEVNNDVEDLQPENIDRDTVRAAFTDLLANNFDMWSTSDDGMQFIMGAYLMMETLLYGRE